MAKWKRWEDSEVARSGKWECSELARWGKWESSEEARGRFLVLLKDGGRRVNPRFHLFVSDVDRSEEAGWV